MPSHEEVVEFLQRAEGKIGKKDIARAFGVSGTEDRRALKDIIKDLENSGVIEKSTKSSITLPDILPNVCELEITGVDSNGALIARPLHFRGNESEKPQVLIADNGRTVPPVDVGDLVLARLSFAGKTTYHGEILKRLTAEEDSIVGIFESFKSGRGGVVLPAERIGISEFFVHMENTLHAEDGDLVLAQIVASQRGNNQAKVVKIIGSGNDARNISLIALYQKSIPIEFPREVLDEAKKLVNLPFNQHRDMTNIPFVTIDGKDAHDFDDAVFAKPDGDGWKLAIAIADVSHYVKPGSAIDREAYKRGNSTYLPDRAVPMLPHELSSDVCSLVEGKPRACVVFNIHIDKDGKILSHSYVRGVIKSVARLDYDEVQAAINGDYNVKTETLKEHIANLYGAYKCLKKSRIEREALELERDERRIIADKNGEIVEIATRPYYDSHKLIEEFMISANVCAALQLEAKDMPVMYRVHERPGPEKTYNLREFLNSLGIKLPKNKPLDNAMLNKLVREQHDHPNSYAINEMVLRSQSQACYSPDNKGHFGLALESYAHFTSPIRRYSDLLVHRALFNELSESERENFHKIATHISMTERRSAEAERDTEDRYLSYYLKSKVDSIFDGIISGVARAGVFVRLPQYGANGFIPMSYLQGGFFVHEPERQRLISTNSRRSYTMGDRIKVRLLEAAPLTGGLIFEIVEGKRK